MLNGGTSSIFGSSGRRYLLFFSLSLSWRLQLVFRARQMNRLNSSLPWHNDAMPHLCHLTTASTEAAESATAAALNRHFSNWPFFSQVRESRNTNSLVFLGALKNRFTSAIDHSISDFFSVAPLHLCLIWLLFKENTYQNLFSNNKLNNLPV